MEELGLDDLKKTYLKSLFRISRKPLGVQNLDNTASLDVLFTVNSHAD